MFERSPNGIITMTRGEYKKFPLFINASHKMTPVRYVINSEDKVCVYVCEPNQLIEDAIIKKVYTQEDLNEFGDVMITFESKDTFYLEPGTYYYEIKLVNSRTIKTIIPKSKFIIVE